MNTQKHLLTALTFFACAIGGIAQQQAPITSPASSAATIPKEYVSTDGRFKVLFPAKPNEIHETIDSPMGKVPFHMLICPFTSTVSYHVFYMDYPIDLEQAGLVKKALDSARQGSLSRIAKEDPHIVEESDISIDGHAGRFLRIELKGDAVARMRYFVVGNRVYVVGLGSPKQNPKVVEPANDYETIATRFMDSFKITPPLETDMAAIWQEFSSTEGKFKVQFPGTPHQSSAPAESLGLVHVAQYQSAGLYSAMYIDYKETPKDLVATIELLDSLRLGELDQLVKQGITPILLSETTIFLNGHPGRVLVLEFSNRIYRRKMLVVKNRIYIITATAPKDDATTRNKYETLSVRFLNSFSFIA
ncbi:MAG TPA: hypothetical protein VFY67_08840 [Pyrinomonadaceae bacterium]|nr:hypothetical protein [Pyrinomonadaceae bacterium]